MLRHPLGHLSRQIGILMTIGFLSACAKEPPPTFYNKSGQVAQVIRCPVGEYEVCLQQISDACQETGYTVYEKVRQIKSGVWSDSAELLMVAQCNIDPKALRQKL